MKHRTFDKWKELGYYVRKGEKFSKRNKKGFPVFSEEQVEEQEEFEYYDDHF